MQVYLQQRIAGTECPPTVPLPIPGNLDALSLPMHLVSPHQGKDQVRGTRVNLHKWRTWLDRRQIAVAVDERRHINGKPACGFCPIACLISQNVFRLLGGIPKKIELGRYTVRPSNYGDVDIGILTAAGRTTIGT